MKAKQLFETINYLEATQNFDEIDITHIEINSKKCVPNSLFVCTKGMNTDSHNYVDEAIVNGAVLLLVERLLNVNIPQILVKNTRQALSQVCASFFSYPSQQLKLIGITGTNGKTTTTYVCKHVLETCEKKVGLIGTEGVWIGSEYQLCDLTTPDPFALQQLFRQMVDKKCEYCVMEVSAHAIALNKIAGISFEVGLLTNITQDHLDYFGTLDHYADTKLGFLASKNVKLAILNADDERCYAFKDSVTKKIAYYGINNPSDVFCTNINLLPNGSNFYVNAFDEVSQVKTPLCGEFNVYNVLGVIAICMHLGLELREICDALQSTPAIPGRFQTIAIDHKRFVVIDFAHTPDSMEKLLKSVHQICPKPVICLFGSAGNRDRTKRALMGKIAEQNADFLVITSDNPKFEKPEFIMHEIYKGLEKSNHILIPDRRIAVAIALEYLCEGGTLVLCGKGAEKYQDINGIKTPYSDLEEVKKFILAQKQSEESEASEC